MEAVRHTGPHTVVARIAVVHRKVVVHTVVVHMVAVHMAAVHMVVHMVVDRILGAGVEAVRTLAEEVDRTPGMEVVHAHSPVYGAALVGVDVRGGVVHHVEIAHDAFHGTPVDHNREMDVSHLLERMDDHILEMSDDDIRMKMAVHTPQTRILEYVVANNLPILHNVQVDASTRRNLPPRTFVLR